MEVASSILLVDEGELDRVQQLLQRLGLEWSRCLENAASEPLPRPRDVLITSGPRAMRMPVLLGENEPVWVCIYDQDFLPLRDRLRDLGVHYLVSGEVRARDFALFLRQLLHPGPERRSTRRIPIRVELELEVGYERRRGLLLDLSSESCSVLTENEVPAGRRVRLRLPGELTGEAPCAVAARVVRASGGPALAGQGGVTTVLRFDALEGDASAAVQRVVTGFAPGTQLTPLAPEPVELESLCFGEGELVHGSGLDAAGSADEIGAGPAGARGERRAAPRRPFDAPLQAIRWPGQQTPRPALGRDLSRTGMRIVVSPLPEMGEELALAIHTGVAREEPLLVDASVVRVGEGEAALRFGALTPDQQRRLRRLLESQPSLERLGAGASPLHWAEFVSR